MSARPEPRVKKPDTWLTWRVSWRDDDGAHTGLVIDAARRREGAGFVTRLRVAGDDGFLYPGVDAAACGYSEG